MREAKYPSWEPTYLSWSRMISRCTDPKNNRYYRYGARGITVCKRWLVYENFLADMGKRPKDHSLDRIDNDGNYKPSNCRWATRLEQMRNTSRTVRIGDLSIHEAAAVAGVTPSAICGRMKLGWSLNDVVRPKLGTDGLINGIAFAHMAGIGRTSLGRLMKKGLIAPVFTSKGGRHFFNESQLALVAKA